MAYWRGEYVKYGCYIVKYGMVCIWNAYDVVLCGVAGIWGLYGIVLYDTECICYVKYMVKFCMVGNVLYMLCLVYGIVLYGTECLWNVYGHLIELMVI